MISVRCPHCLVGLKVDEGKIPSGLLSFKCPKCKELIPTSLLYQKQKKEDLMPEPDTVLIRSVKSGIGRLLVIPNEQTNEQTLTLHEGVLIIGRKSTSQATDAIGIETTDKSMSREHIRIEVKKNAKGGYKHFLSDNNSKNHTLYNSNCLEKGEIVVLTDNDEIVIGRTQLRFNE